METLERACEEGRVLPAMGAAVAAAQRHCSASLGRRGAPPCAFPGVPGGARRGPGSGGRQAVNRSRPNLNPEFRFVTAAQANGWRSPAQVACRCRHSDVGTRNGCHFTARRAAGARGCGSSEHWCNKPALMRSSCLVPPLPQPPLPPPTCRRRRRITKGPPDLDFSGVNTFINYRQTFLGPSPNETSKTPVHGSKDAVTHWRPPLFLDP